MPRVKKTASGSSTKKGRQSAVSKSKSTLRKKTSRKSPRRKTVQSKRKAAKQSPEPGKVYHSIVGSLSHYINQPLTAILGCSDWLLTKGFLGRADRLTVEKIINEANRIGFTLRQLEKMDINDLPVKTYLDTTEILDLSDVLEAGRPTQSEGGSPLEAVSWMTSDEALFNQWTAVTDVEPLGQLVQHACKQVSPKAEAKLWMYDEDHSRFHSLPDHDENMHDKDLFLSVMQSLHMHQDSKSGRCIFPVTGPRYRHGVLEIVAPSDGLGVQVDPTKMLLFRWLGSLAGLSLSCIRATRESLHLRNYLVQIFDNATVMFLTLDGQGKPVLFNRAVEESLGYRAKEFTKTPFYHYGYDAQDKTVLQSSIENALVSGLGEPVSVQLMSENKSPIHVRLHFSALPETQGRKERILAIGENLTEIRSLEEQVIQTDKLASLGQMAAGVAHELNNPVTILSVYSEDLLSRAMESGEDENMLSRLKNMNDSAHRIRELANSLTTLSKPVQKENFGPVNLNRVIADAVVFTGYEIERHSVQIQLELDDSIPEVFGIAANIQQIFINLLVNAAQAFENRSGKVLIRTQSLQGPYVQAMVVDNGPGIDEAYLSKIFDPFFSTKETKGTGLGLSIVRRIVDQLGGEIEVQSRLGQGASFFIRFQKITTSFDGETL